MLFPCFLVSLFFCLLSLLLVLILAYDNLSIPPEGFCFVRWSLRPLVSRNVVRDSFLLYGKVRVKSHNPPDVPEAIAGIATGLCFVRVSNFPNVFCWAEFLRYYI